MWLCWEVCLNWFVVNTLFGLRETLHPWVETLMRIVILVDYLVDLESLNSYLNFATISHSCFDSLVIMNDWFQTCNTLNHVNLKWFTSKVFDWLQSLNELCTNDVWVMFFKVYFGLLFEDKQSFKLGRVGAVFKSHIYFKHLLTIL